MSDEGMPERCDRCGKLAVDRSYPWQLKICDRCHDEMFDEERDRLKAEFLSGKL